MLLSLLPTILSALTIGVLIYIDHTVSNDKTMYSLSIFIKYITSFFLCIFNYYLLPYLIFKIVKIERNELKSAKEQSFVTKNIILMILNSLIFPFIASAILTFLSEDNHVKNES